VQPRCSAIALTPFDQRQVYTDLALTAGVSLWGLLPPGHPKCSTKACAREAQ